MAVRPDGADPEAWTDAIFAFATSARRLTGNPVQTLDYDLDEVRRRASPRAKTGKAFWEALRHDSVVLAGASIDHLTGENRVATR